jgi:hypothetical protein
MPVLLGARVGGGRHAVQKAVNPGQEQCILQDEINVIIRGRRLQGAAHRRGADVLGAGTAVDLALDTEALTAGALQRKARQHDRIVASVLTEGILVLRKEEREQESRAEVEVERHI